MRILFLAGASLLVLSGCATPISQQTDQLATSTACCSEFGKIHPSGTIGAETNGEFAPQTPLVLVDGKRSPAVRFLVPAALAGRQLEVRFSPMDAGYGSRGLAFAPVAIAFLAADGSTLPIVADSGVEAGPARSFAYSYALWRTVTVPAGAASAVFYADPSLYGTERMFSYRFGGLMPAGGILLAQSANAKAIYKVYGEFSVKTL